MSFKSKQRAKHSLLFGDDPLSAAVMETDESLFKTSPRSANTSQWPSPSATPSRGLDPLLPTATSSPSSTHSSPQTSLHTMDSHGKTNHQHTTGLLGERSGLRKAGEGTSSPKRTLFLSSSTSPRSSVMSENEEDLFGGASPRKPKELSGASLFHHSIPTLGTGQPVSSPVMNRQPSPVSIPTTPAAAMSVSPQVSPLPESVPVAKEPRARPSSSLFASASRLIRMRSSSIPSPKPEPKPEPRIEPRIEPTVESNEQEQEKHTSNVIEDEATRAFADTFIKVKPVHTFDYPSSPEFTLRIDAKPSLIPSSSTPASTLGLDPSETLNPWYDMNAAMIDPPSASTSSPSISTRIRSHRPPVPTPPMEPVRQAAFADLIASWHHGQHPPSLPSENSEQFLERVAIEQRDIGFAGICGPVAEETEDRMEEDQSQGWAIETDNPWC
ncbi:hypothetical protein BDF14DRAFT_1741906 [Spinellus fusiger]|nr:hypothetical protein BDF14DRAFT_1741906 [Spinellus fusiger]